MRALSNRTGQSGLSFILMTAFIAVAMSALGVVSVGQYYWEYGRMQKIVDMASLAAAREMHGGPPFALATQVATSNGLLQSDQITYTCMVDDGVDPAYETLDCSVGNVVQVDLQRTVQPFFLFPAKQASVSAQSTEAPSITGTIQSSLVVAGLAGLNATLVGGGSLASANFKFSVLDLAAELGLTSISDLPNTTVSASDALQAAIDLSGATGLDLASDDWQDLETLLGAAPAVRIGDVLQTNLQHQLQGSLNIKLDDFARVLGMNAIVGQSIGLTTEGQTLMLNSALSPIYSVAGIQNLKVKILEPPQIFVGRKVPGGGDIATVSTSQIEVQLDLKITGDAGLLNALSNKVELGSNTQFTIGLRFKGVGGTAVVKDLTCSIPEEDNSIETEVTSTLTSFEICPCDGQDNPVDLLTVDVLSITNQNALNGVLGSLVGLLGGIGLDDFETVTLQLGKESTAPEDALLLDVSGDPEQVDFTGVNFPYSAKVPLDLGGSLQNIFGPNDYYVTVSANSEDSLILEVVNINQLTSAVTAALGPALGNLGGVLNDVLADAGIELNSVELRVEEVDCEHTVLSK